MGGGWGWDQAVGIGGPMPTAILDRCRCRALGPRAYRDMRRSQLRLPAPAGAVTRPAPGRPPAAGPPRAPPVPRCGVPPPGGRRWRTSASCPPHDAGVEDPFPQLDGRLDGGGLGRAVQLEVPARSHHAVPHDHQQLPRRHVLLRGREPREAEGHGPHLHRAPPGAAARRRLVHERGGKHLPVPRVHRRHNGVTQRLQFARARGHRARGLQERHGRVHALLTTH